MRASALGQPHLYAVGEGVLLILENPSGCLTIPASRAAVEPPKQGYCQAMFAWMPRTMTGIVSALTVPISDFIPLKSLLGPPHRGISLKRGYARPRRD